MSSAAKLAANAANAQSSTGPRTEEGKNICSTNAITAGLYARRDFIRPEEEPDYVKLQTQIQAELAPVGLLEQNLVDEIRRCLWRLRRCGHVEADIILRLHSDFYIFDAMETDDKHSEKMQKSVDRARSQCHRILHKCTAELRKLQTDRQFAAENLPADVDRTSFGLIEWRRIIKPAPRRNAGVGLFCNQTKNPAESGHGVARNALCPCKSGLKYKRCCGQNAPPVLRAA